MARVTHDASIQRDKCLSAYRLPMQTRHAGTQMDGHADADYSLRWKGNGVPCASGVAVRECIARCHTFKCVHETKRPRLAFSLL